MGSGVQGVEEDCPGNRDSRHRRQCAVLPGGDGRPHHQRPAQGLTASILRSSLRCVFPGESAVACATISSCEIYSREGLDALREWNPSPGPGRDEELEPNRGRSPGALEVIALGCGIFAAAVSLACLAVTLFIPCEFGWIFVCVLALSAVQIGVSIYDMKECEYLSISGANVALGFSLLAASAIELYLLVSLVSG